MMNIRKIGILIVMLLLVNNAIFTLFPLPGIVDTIAVTAAAVLLFMGVAKGGAMGKTFLVVSIIVAIYALLAILSYVGIALPLAFLYIVYKWVIITAIALLGFQFFTN